MSLAILAFMQDIFSHSGRRQGLEGCNSIHSVILSPGLSGGDRLKRMVGLSEEAGLLVGKKAKKPYTARRLYKSTKRTQRSAGMKYPGVGSKIGSAVGSAFGPAGSLLGGAGG